VHTRAVLRDPRAYEVLDPNDFGLARNIEVGSRYTGRYAVGHRAALLGLELTKEEIAELTCILKTRTERGSLSQEEVDTFILSWHQEKKGSLIWER
jgi:homocitrate synthase